MTDTVCDLQFKLSAALIALEKVDRTFAMTISFRDGAVHKHVKNAIRSIKGAPRLVVVGDHSEPLGDPENFDLLQPELNEVTNV